MDRSIKRADSLGKVMGKAIYTDDLQVGNLLHIKVVTSPYSHAKIKNIERSKALQMPGVVAVFTAEDIEGNLGTANQKPILAMDKVRYRGEGVALVVAETEKEAINATKAIKVSYELLEAVFDPEEALDEKSPKVHEKSNLVCQWKVRKGNVEQGFKNADLVIEREYSTHAVFQGHLETEIAVAVPTNDGVEVYCPSKAPFGVRNRVSQTLGITQSQVRVIQTAIGGSFGAKGPDAAIIASRTAFVAIKTGKPCKLIYTKEDSIIKGAKRHPYKMKYKVGVKNNGQLTAMEVFAVADAGAYAEGTYDVTARSAVEATGPYVIENVKTDVLGVYTNNVYSDAARGFGSPQVDFASEQLIYELADILKIDPLEIRRINGLKEGDVSATGQVMRSVSLNKCLDAIEKNLNWTKKDFKSKVNSPGTKARGKGIACMFRGEAFGAGGLDVSGGNVYIQPDASITVLTGLADVGQGSHTALKKIVCETLGVKPERVFVRQVDTAYVPDSGPAVASRGTVMAGNAILNALEKIKERLIKTAAELMQVSTEDIILAHEQAVSKTELNKFVPYERIVQECYIEGIDLYAHGWWKGPDTFLDQEGKRSDPFFSYVYGACGAEVEVDLVTGKIDVINFVAAHDVGYAINELEVKNQIAGGINMGIGYALMEDLGLEKGEIHHTNYHSYLMPTAMDIQNTEHLIVENASLVGPLGAKGLGEPATSIVAPTILNAVADAIGKRIYHLPASLESVKAKIGE
jgi:CO/xanthine dehydrogenase Mo-binding subunit